MRRTEEAPRSCFACGSTGIEEVEPATMRRRRWQEEEQRLEVVFLRRTEPGPWNIWRTLLPEKHKDYLPPRGKSWRVQVLCDGVQVEWVGEWGPNRFPRPPSVETVGGEAGDRRTLSFVGKKRICGQRAWIYKVEGGLERAIGDSESAEIAVGEDGWFPKRRRLNFAHLAAPAPLRTLVPPESRL